MAEPSKTKILGFNGLRGLCVTGVFLSHKVGLGFYSGQLGVWAFLALSGFLIIGELHRARQEMEAGRYSAGTAVRTFATKRALRIFPIYYALLALLFIARHAFAPPGTDLGFAWHVTYLSNYFIAYVNEIPGTPFGVLWTLSVEQQFYVLAPLAFILSPARRHVAICLGVAVVAGAGHLAMCAAGTPVDAIHITSPWNFAVIALGGAAGILTRDGVARQRIAATWPLALALLVVAAYAASALIPDADAVVAGVPTIGVGLGLALLVAWIRCNQDSAVVRALEWRPLEALGVVSYGFYLIHNFIPSRSIPGHIGLGAHPIIGLAAGTAISFAISATLAGLSWRLYEKPILGLRARLLPRRASPVEAVAGAAGSPI